MNIKKSFVLFAVVAILTTGCRSKDEYKKLADAGNKYANAVTTLLSTAGEIKVRATSEQLLANDQISALNTENYISVSQQDKNRLAVINDLITHNQLLQAYFEKIEELATSSSPDQAKKEIDNITDNLTEIGDKLKATEFARSQSLIATVGKLVIDEKISGVLRETIQKDNPLILQQLHIQQVMLNQLSEYIQADVKIIADLRELRLVMKPLLETTAISEDDKDKWIQTRQKILAMQTKSAELKRASVTLGEFKNMYQAFLSGKHGKQNLNDFVNNVNSFTAMVDKNKDSLIE